jgi:hypothetical protein
VTLLFHIIVYVTSNVPDGVFGATVKSPLASTLNGPLVTGVTSVFALLLLELRLKYRFNYTSSCC